MMLSTYAPSRSSRNKGFTLIELLVVMGIIALLLTLAVPRYFSSFDKSKDAILMENLHITRKVIDQFYGDTGRYPDSLQELVQRKYLRTLPVDPITDSDRSWIIVPPEPPYKGQVYDIRSGARGKTKDGRLYSAL